MVQGGRGISILVRRTVSTKGCFEKANRNLPDCKAFDDHMTKYTPAEPCWACSGCEHVSFRKGYYTSVPTSWSNRCLKQRKGKSYPYDS